MEDPWIDVTVAQDGGSRPTDHLDPSFAEFVLGGIIERRGHDGLVGQVPRKVVENLPEVADDHIRLSDRVSEQPLLKPLRGLALREEADVGPTGQQGHRHPAVPNQRLF